MIGKSDTDMFLTGFMRILHSASKHHSCLSLGFLLRECLGDAHEPCDCETWKMWLQKVSEMKPEECRNPRLLTFLKFRIYCSSRPAPLFNGCAAVGFDIKLLPVSEQWLVWAKLMKMLPTACGCSPTLNLVPTANPPSRKTKAVITCSARRSVQNGLRGQKHLQPFECQPAKTPNCSCLKIINYGLKRSDILSGDIGNYTCMACLLRFNIWLLELIIRGILTFMRALVF